MAIEFRTRRSERAANLYILVDGVDEIEEVTREEKQGEGDDEADDDGTDDDDKQGGEGSTIRGGDSTIRGGDSKPDRWV